MSTAIPPVCAPSCLQEYRLSYRPTTGVTSTTKRLLKITVLKPRVFKHKQLKQPIGDCSNIQLTFLHDAASTQKQTINFRRLCEYGTSINHRRSNEGLMQSDNAMRSISLLKEFFYKLLIWTIWEDLLIIDHDKALVLWL